MFGQSSSVEPSGPPVEFTPPTETDVIADEGFGRMITRKHQCITSMKEYETKSLEELRLEDYTAGRKGRASATFGTTTQASPTNASTMFRLERREIKFGLRRSSESKQPQKVAVVAIFGGAADVNDTPSLDSTLGISGTDVKFTPAIGTDTTPKNGIVTVVSTRHQYITGMKEYKAKSFEELRLEDYRKIAERKENSSAAFETATGSSPFGSAVSDGDDQTATGSGAFASNVAKNTTSSILIPKPFGASIATTSAFTFDTASNATASNSIDAHAKPFGASVAKTDVFTFDSGENNATNVFGAAETPLFSTSNTATTQNSATGAQNTGFGTTRFGATQQASQSTSPFNQNKPTFNLPASSTFRFGQTSQANAGSAFCAKPMGTVFGKADFRTTSTAAFENTSPSNSSSKPAGQTFAFGNAPVDSTALETTGTGSFSKPRLFNFTATSSSVNDVPALGIDTNTQQSASSISERREISALATTALDDLLKSLSLASEENERFAEPATSATMENGISHASKAEPTNVAAMASSEKTLHEDLSVKEFQYDPQHTVSAPSGNSAISRACLRIFLLLDKRIMDNWIL